MEDNHNSLALVLDSRPYRENDILVSLYTQKFGRLSLIAKGAKKLSSKMAAHLEPLTLIKLMIIKGRGLDYVGAAVNENSFQGIKNDLTKIFYAGKIIFLFSSLVKDNEADPRLFSLLRRYLETIEAEDNFSKEIGELFWLKFSLSFLKEIGYCPEMNNCLNCKKKLEKGLNYFDLKNGGVICSACLFLSEEGLRKEKSRFYLENETNLLAVSNNCVLLIRYLLDSDNKLKLKAGKSVVKETLKLVEKFILFIK